MSDPTGPQTPVPGAEELAARLGRVRRRIVDAGGDLDQVAILAVTKGFGAEAVRAAVAVGLLDVGENYAQELLAKAAAAASSPATAPRWHAIGRLQRNKVRQLAPVVSCWQSVDRRALGDEIARRSPGARVLVQVNVSDEATKGGCRPEEASSLVVHLQAVGLIVEGLMTIGRTGSPEMTRPGFAQLRHLADDLGLAVRSMGMSSDLEAAVAEGSTQVRIGRDLFGERPSRHGGGASQD
ncbi:MAG: YggS family pyridoxal phosphate-dependent enzyme [Acidimicrobiales bacterium]